MSGVKTTTFSGFVRRTLSVPPLVFIGYLALSVTAVKVFTAHRSSEMIYFSDMLASSRTESERRGSAPALAFVFNPRDCSEALRVARHWSSLHRAGAVSVTGLVVDAPDDPKLLAALLRSEGIGFPVEQRPDDKLLSAMAGLGYDTTPITVLFDDGYRPRLILPSVQDSLAQMKQVELVRAQLAQLEREAGLNMHRDGT